LVDEDFEPVLVIPAGFATFGGDTELARLAFEQGQAHPAQASEILVAVAPNLSNSARLPASSAKFLLAAFSAPPPSSRFFRLLKDV